MIVTIILTAFLVWQNSLALNPNYHECTDDECYYYYNTKDPRNQALDLFYAVESKMAYTIPMPDFELYASFHSGSLQLDYYETGDNECVCPLTSKCDEMYAVFHDDTNFGIYYNWTLYYSPYVNYTGLMGVGGQILYNVYFINETNGGGPSVDRINITSFNIDSWWFDGQPLEILEMIPDELFKKTMVVALKQTIEDTMTSTYNSAIKDMKRNFLHAVPTTQIRRELLNRRKNNVRRKNSSRLLNTLKSQRKVSARRSKYFYRQ